MTPDYIKARAEALYPIYEADHSTVTQIVKERRAAYIKGCTDTLEGSAGVWVKGFPDDNKIHHARIVGHLSEEVHEVVINRLPHNDNLYEAFGRGIRITIPKEKIIQWLDESVPYTPLREGDAVAFYRWIEKNVYWENKATGEWHTWTDNENGPDSTQLVAKGIVELYFIFKGQQPQPATNYREVCEGLAKALEDVINSYEQGKRNRERSGQTMKYIPEVEVAKQQLDNYQKLLK